MSSPVQLIFLQSQANTKQEEIAEPFQVTKEERKYIPVIVEHPWGAITHSHSEKARRIRIQKAQGAGSW
jgi:hypothetical protein